MTQIPPGWYPDPAPSDPGTPGRLRFWDGTQWTEHVHEPQPGPPAPAYPQAQAAQRYPQPQPYAGPALKAAPTTPDGQPLSPWWRRVLAQLLDWLILLPIHAAVVAPVIAANWSDLTAWFDARLEAGEAGTSGPPQPALIDPWSAPFLTVILLTLVVSTVYTLGFWRWKQATPGKLIVGVRIRRRDTPGPMPWSTMLIRFGFIQGLSIAAQIPIVGFLFVLAALLNYLWPLWDRNNQALHDKVAGTNVVLAPTVSRGSSAAG